MALIVHEVAQEMIREIKPLIDSVARHDGELAKQLRKSASSVPLNICEGGKNRKGNSLSRFHTAAGSASETRSALRVAESWGYIAHGARAEVDAKLDRILAMLWGLTANRRR